MHVTTDGKIAPCCEYDGDLGSLSDTTLDEAWQSEALREIRQNFADGENVKGCWKCFDREAGEGQSMRTEKNRKFRAWHELLAKAEDLLNAAPDNPVALDLRFSNLCNFKCRSCWHGASSKWFTDAKAIGATAGDKAEIRSFRSIEDVVAQVGSGLDSLEEVYFAGGEPLIMKEHYALLRLLCERNLTNVRLNYNTNLSVTTFAGQSIFDLWARFESLEVHVSVDAAGARGAYLRSGFNWQTFTRNVQELRVRCPHARLYYGITVSALNILTLPDLLRALEQELGALPNQFNLHSLQEPVHYCTKVLPTHLKQRASRNLQTYLEDMACRQDSYGAARIESFHSVIQGLIDYMNAADLTRHLAAMSRVTDQLDTLRSEDVNVVLPELATLTEEMPWWQKSYIALKRFMR